MRRTLFLLTALMVCVKGGAANAATIGSANFEGPDPFAIFASTGPAFRTNDPLFAGGPGDPINQVATFSSTGDLITQAFALPLDGIVTWKFDAYLGSPFTNIIFSLSRGPGEVVLASKTGPTVISAGGWNTYTGSTDFSTIGSGNLFTAKFTGAPDGYVENFSLTDASVALAVPEPGSLPLLGSAGVARGSP